MSINVESRQLIRGIAKSVLHLHQEGKIKVKPQDQLLAENLLVDIERDIKGMVAPSQARFDVALHLFFHYLDPRQ